MSLFGVVHHHCISRVQERSGSEHWDLSRFVRVPWTQAWASISEMDLGLTVGRIHRFRLSKCAFILYRVFPDIEAPTALAGSLFEVTVVVLLLLLDGVLELGGTRPSAGGLFILAAIRTAAPAGAPDEQPYGSEAQGANLLLVDGVDPIQCPSDGIQCSDKAGGAHTGGEGCEGRFGTVH